MRAKKKNKTPNELNKLSVFERLTTLTDVSKILQTSLNSSNSYGSVLFSTFNLHVISPIFFQFSAITCDELWQRPQKKIYAPIDYWHALNVEGHQIKHSLGINDPAGGCSLGMSWI